MDNNESTMVKQEGSPRSPFWEEQQQYINNIVSIFGQFLHHSLVSFSNCSCLIMSAFTLTFKLVVWLETDFGRQIGSAHGFILKSFIITKATGLTGGVFQYQHWWLPHLQEVKTYRPVWKNTWSEGTFLFWCAALNRRWKCVIPSKTWGCMWGVDLATTASRTKPGGLSSSDNVDLLTGYSGNRTRRILFARKRNTIHKRWHYELNRYIPELNVYPQLVFLCVCV